MRIAAMDSEWAVSCAGWRLLGILFVQNPTLSPSHLPHPGGFITQAHVHRLFYRPALIRSSSTKHPLAGIISQFKQTIRTCVSTNSAMAILSVRTEMSMSTSSLSALVLKRSETFTSQYVAQCYPSGNCHKDLTNCNKSTSFKLQQKALCASLLMAVHWSKDGNVGRNPFLPKVGENMGAKTRCSPRTQMQSRRTLA